MVQTEQTPEANGSSQQDVSKGVSSADTTQSAPTLPAPPPNILDGIDIKDPVELLFLVDEDVQRGKANGGIDLHDWQIQFMVDFANEHHTKDHPFMAEVCAANGSGKDMFIVAACIVWLCLRYKHSWGVATNGSGVQLDNQTERHIRRLCNKVNTKFGCEIWKCNYRNYTCIPTDSYITLFATDEPNKAEGFHELGHGCKLAIFASEAKAVTDDIFTALTRCHDTSYRVDVSSPGRPQGYFYEQFTAAIPRETIKNIKEVPPTERVRYLITAYQCSHISPTQIENFANSLPGGKNSPVFKSGILAEFTTLDEMVVIPYVYVYKAFSVSSGIQWLPDAYNKAGLDLSDGGDETVLTIRNGNKHLATIPFKFDNTEDTVEYLQQKFNEWSLNNEKSKIFADCGGLGKPILDRLKRLGWGNIVYVDNRSTPSQPRTYLNRGAEVWFHTRQLFERGELIVLNDRVLIRQLSARYYKINQQNKHQLLSKLESRSRGYPSPDRADSFVLAFWDYKSTKGAELSDVKVKDEKKRPIPVRPPQKPQPLFSLREYAHESASPRTLHQFKQTLRKKQNMSQYQELIDAHNKNIILSKVTVEQPVTK